MAKIALITDTHYGIRGDNQVFYDYFKKFYDKVFFPYIDGNGIKTVIHLGDLVDRRKYVNYLTAKRLNDDLMQPMFDRGLDLHILCGNHDDFYKGTNEFNAIKALYGESKHSFALYENPMDVTIDGLQITMLPWICDATYDATMELVRTTKSQILMGHLELSGFEIYKGHITDHGMDKEMFDKFDAVYSGHYHHKSSHGNIHYLGAPAQYTWTDYDDPKGFHVLDTDTREVEFIRNPYELFRKVYYDDQNRTAEEVMDFDASSYTGAYTKVIVKNKNDPYLFDRMVGKLEGARVTDLQVIEDSLNLDSIDDEDLVDEAQDTMTILKKYIASLETNLPRKKIDRFVQELYTEALNIEK